MSDFIAFQQFKPSEQNQDNRCIWCKTHARKNKAHIISRKLTLTSHADAVLKYSVCERCNSRCGQIERWILKYSPLGWMRFFLYFSSNKGSNTTTIPSYFYEANLKEWLTYTLIGKGQRRSIDTQLLLNATGELRLIIEPSSEEERREILNVLGDLVLDELKSDVRPSLPGDFSPRAIIGKDGLLLVGQSPQDLDRLRAALKNAVLHPTAVEKVPVTHSGQDQFHFRWSTANWVRLCAKIAYETLCLVKGSKHCLQPEYEGIRKFLLEGLSSEYREIVFDNHGPTNQLNVPRIAHVDLTMGQNATTRLPGLLLHVEPGMHTVALYEIDGWICASVSISGFPSSVLVLAGPNAHLDDIYISVYDEESDMFDFVHLADDKGKPIIPLQLAGNMHEAIRRTYKLSIAKC